jgi:type III restriction enzyme
MRLPFGQYTGIQMLDTVEVLAHERYVDLLAKREALNEQFVDYGVWMQTHVTESGTVAQKHTTDPVPVPVSMSGDEGAQPKLGLVMVLDLNDVTKSAASEAANTTSKPREHTPLPERQQIELPYVEHVPIPVVVTLNSIDDDKEFTDLAKGLAVDADEELKRTVLKPAGTKIEGIAAEDHIQAAKLSIPLEQSKQALVDAVLSAPGVQQRASELKAAEKIATAIIDTMGTDAEKWLSAYLDTAQKRLRSTVTAKLSSVLKGGVIYSDEVKTEPLNAVRKCARRHEAGQVETFQKSVAYNGWTRNLYEYAWFDSAPEYAAARAIDKDDNVLVWARLQINDIPITWTSGGQRYNPDFVVVEKDGDAQRSWLVEVKGDNTVGSEDVATKKQAAITWSNTVTNAGHGNWSYLLLSESDVKDSKGKWEQMKKLHQ